jgi:beta-phosphoglucomutase-like phosphatase (HAD superfamily)
MLQNRFDLVIFDCDGVLVDSEPLAAVAYHNVYANQGMPLPEGTIAQCIGMKQSDIIKRIAELTGHQLSDKAETGLWPETRRVFSQSLRPTPGIRALLETLETPRCVASSSSLERILPVSAMRSTVPPWSNAANPHLTSFCMPPAR